jgi:ABC-type Fe3+/spermidine/putrescine transport system ATPase subunit
VTHEQIEAFEVGDRVAVLEGGRLAQLGTPQDLYDRPADPFVAGFVGRASWLAGRLSQGRRLIHEEGELPWTLQPVGELPVGARVRVLLRPEQLTLGPATLGGRGLAGTVTDVRFAGAETFYAVKLAGGEQLEVSSRYGRAERDQAVAVALAPDAPPLPTFPVPGESAGGGT